MCPLISGFDSNMLRPSDQPFGTTTGDGVTPCSAAAGNCNQSASDLARLPFPTLSDSMIGYGNMGHGLSNAFQTEFNRRFAGGLMFNATYTLLSQNTSAPDTGFTPFWTCDNCGPYYPGNMASSSLDATGGFNGTSFRPVVTGKPMVTQGDRIFDPLAFGLPPLGAGLFDDPSVARRNLLWGPGTWGVNLGSFAMDIDPKTLKPFYSATNRNTDFGRLLTSFTQEGVDSRRTVRLKLRLTF